MVGGEGINQPVFIRQPACDFSRSEQFGLLWRNIPRQDLFHRLHHSEFGIELDCAGLHCGHDYISSDVESKT